MKTTRSTLGLAFLLAASNAVKADAQEFFNPAFTEQAVGAFRFSPGKPPPPRGKTAPTTGSRRTGRAL